MTTVMIIAGESSGELYGALLARELKKKWPDLQIIGIGGAKMQETGVRLIAKISDAFGLVEAVSSLRKVKIALNRAGEALKEFRPEVLIPIDYPDFNLRVAAMARPLGVRVLYYVSPQVWAWRGGRVKKIAGLVDKMAVILPFEEKIYRDAGVACEFVGHPVLEEIEEVLGTDNRNQMSDVGYQNSRITRAGTSDILPVAPISESRAYYKAALGFQTDRPLLSLLPGSRPGELSRHFPVIIDAVRQFKNDPAISPAMNCQFSVPLAPNTDEDKFRPYIEVLRREGVAVRKGESVRALAASDTAVVASGTATLQAALLEVPMVVIYKLSPLTYHLGKRIVKVKHISLVNILAGREVVREFLQDKATPVNITEELKKIMFEKQHGESMIAEFRLIKEKFAGKKPSARVAEIVMEMAGRTSQQQ